MSMKNSNDTIWNRTSDLLICSTAPEPLCYRGPPYIYIYRAFSIYIYICVGIVCVCVCVCVCVYIYIYIYIWHCMSVCIYVYVCKYTHTHTIVYICVCVSPYIGMHAPVCGDIVIKLQHFVQQHFFLSTIISLLLLQI